MNINLTKKQKIIAGVVAGALVLAGGTMVAAQPGGVLQSSGATATGSSYVAPADQTSQEQGETAPTEGDTTTPPSTDPQNPTPTNPTNPSNPPADTPPANDPEPETPPTPPAPPKTLVSEDLVYRPQGDNMEYGYCVSTWSDGSTAERWVGGRPIGSHGVQLAC